MAKHKILNAFVLLSLLTAVGLSPAGSSAALVQTKINITQNSKTTQNKKNNYKTIKVSTQTEHRKNKYNTYYKNSRARARARIHTHTHTHTHTYIYIYYKIYEVKTSVQDTYQIK
jgi:hypothetical protein